MKRTLLIALIALLALTRSAGQNSLVSFSHLAHLTERILLKGDSVSVVHVYAKYPEYRWVDAKESGPEGVACVDDAARAAVVYLRHFELTGSGQSLREGKELLKFVLKMQASDGQFYNFIFADHTLNREGKTSARSFGWWAARGVWSMSLGYRVLRSIDSSFALQLRRGVERSLPHVRKLSRQYGKIDMLAGFQVPRWLLSGSAADATSELLLGLLEYYAATGSRGVRRDIANLARGLTIMQEGDAATFPYALHRSWNTLWHMWGNSQTHVLATAGKALGDSLFIRSAEREADSFYPRLLIKGFVNEIHLAAPEETSEFAQIAYGVRPMVLGLLRLYEVSGKREYLIMAGLSASWLFGNNPPGVAMYNPHTGRCFDGIRDSVTVNRNSGAESTIEALMTLIELENHPDALPYCRYRKVRSGEQDRLMFALYRDGEGHELTLVLDTSRAAVRVLEGAESMRFMEGVR